MSSSTEIATTKTCTKCRAVKAATTENFHRKARQSDGLHYTCKACRKSETAKYHAKNRDRRIEEYFANHDMHLTRMREYRERNREVSRAASRRWYCENKERIRRRQRERRAEDSAHRLKRNISTSLANALNGLKAGQKWEKIVGYDLATLRRHLERQFLRGMSWENYGSAWHVDHIVPQSLFPKTIEGITAAWRLSNIRPLWARENQQKSDKRTHLL